MRAVDMGGKRYFRHPGDVLLRECFLEYTPTSMLRARVRACRACDGFNGRVSAGRLVM